MSSKNKEWMNDYIKVSYSGPADVDATEEIDGAVGQKGLGQ